MIRHFMS